MAEVCLLGQVWRAYVIAPGGGCRAMPHWPELIVVMACPCAAACLIGKDSCRALGHHLSP
jgi:hypothetical protein